jgi:hypothetical protein
VSRFNLRFWGEILPGKDPAVVKQRFGKLFGIDDPAQVEKFFSGDSIILRRNLERKTAAEYFHKLHLLGVEAELVRAGAETPPSTPRDSDRTTGGDREQPPQRQAGRKSSAKGTARPRKTAEDTARKEAEDATRRQAEEAERQHRAAKEAARRKAEEEAARRKAEEAERQRRAEEADRQRKAAEEAARRKAEEAERQRRAEEAERQRRAAEVAARRKAEEAERQRKAEEAERQRKAAEEAARRKAEVAERQRRAAEEAARRKAEEAERQRKAAEEKRRREAEEAERQRIAAEKAARRKAEEAERQRKAAEEKRRREAEERARKRAEQQRRKEEERARRQAQREEARRKASEASAKAAAERARRQEEKRLAAAEAARIRAEQQEKKRRLAEQAERKRAEEQRQREAEEARARAAQKEQEAQRKAMEAQAIARGAQELGRRTTSKAAGSGVKTTLSIPARRTATAEPQRRRQVGEPNLYTVEPFRNTADVQGRAARAGEQMGLALKLTLAALALLLIAGGRYLSLSPPPPVDGPEAMAVNPGSGPLLIAGSHLLPHDRSGSPLEAFELADFGALALRAPMAFTRRDLVLAPGLSQADDAGAENGQWPLLACDLGARQCEPFTGSADHRVDGIAVHPLNGEIFVADAAAKALSHFSAEGELLASAEMEVPGSPVIRLDSGLLFMNSASGPAISVFRYEADHFGKQLDEILLLPPAAVNTGQNRVGDFARAGEYWWAILFNPEDGNADLFRFDSNWQFVEEARLPSGFHPQYLSTWNDKLLVADPGSLEVLRFNAQGMAEAPLASSSLRDLAEQVERDTRRSQLAWRTALAICVTATLAGLVATLFLRMRSMVYRTSRERGAEPVDDLADSIRWIAPVAEREAILRRRTNVYLLAAALGLVAVVALAVHQTTLMALLVALAGPALALALLRRHGVGNIGVAGDQLLLVDHRQVYHLGGGSRVQHRGPFLLIDDVITFTGTRLLPAFAPEQVEALVDPLRQAGVRVDRSTVAVKLLQSRHALALGALVTLLSTAVAAALLLIPGL